MFTATVAPIEYKAPWTADFETRLAMLCRGSPRAAYFYERPDTSTFRYRVYNVVQSLAGNGRDSPAASWFTNEDLDQMDRVLDRCDLLVLCRTRYTDRIARLVEMARSRGRRVLFDSDDLVFDPRYAHLILDTLGHDMSDMAVWDSWFAYVGRMAATFGLCDGAITTNGYLAARAREAFRDDRPVTVIPNYLEPAQQALSAHIWTAKEQSGWDSDGTVTIGYFSGTPTHNNDFALVAGPLARLMDEDKRIRLRLVGFLDPGPRLARHQARIETFPLQDHLNLQRVLGQVEVNVVPLQDNVFTNCKSELKWFESAVVGTLTIATPTYTYNRAIDQDRTGWLVEGQGWLNAMRSVTSAIGEHRPVAIAARDAALAKRGWQVQSPNITAALFGA